MSWRSTLPKPAHSRRLLVALCLAASAATAAAADLPRLGRNEILASVTDTPQAYLLKDNQRTLVLDFSDLRSQARAFGRIILFIERDGTPKTRLMTDAEVRKWLTQNAASLESLTLGNNFRAEELARFFNTARFQGESLSADERRLYDWLLQLRVLREDANGVAPAEPEYMLVSIPQASSVAGCAACKVTPAQRKAVLEHELAHARFATEAPYRHYAQWFWSQRMDIVARSKFTQFLRKRGYDTGNRELLANEMQAFLLHTPDAAMFGPAAVGMTEAELEELRAQFKAGMTGK